MKKYPISNQTNHIIFASQFAMFRVYIVVKYTNTTSLFTDQT